jgi:hypothetical protein
VAYLVPRYLLRPQFMLKYVDSTVLSATSVCSITLYASEKAVSRNWYLVGSHVSKRYYQRLSYGLNMLLQPRYSFDKP